jgi:hypothetical protein
VQECYCALLGDSASMKTLASNHVTSSLSGLPYATIELCFLCVVPAEAIYPYISSEIIHLENKIIDSKLYGRSTVYKD